MSAGETYPDKLPIGILYPSKVFGGLVRSTHEAKLVCMWGAKGQAGLEARSMYVIPVLSGLVCEYVNPEDVTEPLADE